MNYESPIQIIIDNAPRMVSLRYIGQMRGASQNLTFYKSDKEDSYVRIERRQEEGFYTQDWHEFSSLGELQEIAQTKHFALEAFANNMLAKVQ